MAFDDCDWPSTHQACRFIAINSAYRVCGTTRGTPPGLRGRLIRWAAGHSKNLRSIVKPKFILPDEDFGMLPTAAVSPLRKCPTSTPPSGPTPATANSRTILYRSGYSWCSICLSGGGVPMNELAPEYLLPRCPNCGSDKTHRASDASPRCWSFVVSYFKAPIAAKPAITASSVFGFPVHQGATKRNSPQA